MPRRQGEGSIFQSQGGYVAGYDTFSAVVLGFSVDDRFDLADFLPVILTGQVPFGYDRVRCARKPTKKTLVTVA